jgi:hypothetical protein
MPSVIDIVLKANVPLVFLFFIKEFQLHVFWLANAGFQNMAVFLNRRLKH